MRTCPHCRKPIPEPNASDFERIPTRDKERLLERMTVNKGASQSAQHRPMLARFEIGADGKMVAYRADE